MKCLKSHQLPMISNSYPWYIILHDVWWLPCHGFYPVCIGSFPAWATATIETELHCRMKVTGLLVVSVSHISQNCYCMKFRPPQFSL
jgi:hypothetical protein